jgi:hypothetical protein
VRSWVTGTSFFRDPTYLNPSTTADPRTRGCVRRATGFETKAAHAESGSPLAAELSQDAPAGAVAPGNVRLRLPMKCSRARQQKKWRRQRLWKSRGVEKSKNDFPTPLGNPANPAGFPLCHSLGDYGRLTKKRTFHLLRKGATSNVVRMGTFLMSVDITYLLD